MAYGVTLGATNWIKNLIIGVEKLINYHAPTKMISYHHLLYIAGANYSLFIIQMLSPKEIDERKNCGESIERRVKS